MRCAGRVVAPSKVATVTRQALAKRLDALEAAQPSAAPPYVSVADDDALRVWLARYDGPPVKVYITVSPDDWDGEP